MIMRLMDEVINLDAKTRDIDDDDEAVLVIAITMLKLSVIQEKIRQMTTPSFGSLDDSLE